MEPKHRRELALLVAVVVLGAGLYAAIEGWPWASPGASGPAPAFDGPAPTAHGDRAPRTAAETPGVHLAALSAARPKPDQARRDLFRFRPKPAVMPTARPTEPPPASAGPPSPPPIALKFIGIVDAGQPKKVVAVLSDGRGAPVYGSEGETVLGQYRILRIGTESIELSYLDGRGRQTIRFTGS